LSGPKVLVAADQLEEARQIAARPIPQDIIDDSRMKLPEFEPPTCQYCGAADPMLKGSEPCNQWVCEECGREWADAAEPGWEAGPKSG